MEIPITTCPNCQDDVPVILKEIDIEELGYQVVAVYCPICEQLINQSDDLKIDFYELDNLPPDFKWGVTIDGSEATTQ